MIKKIILSNMEYFGYSYKDLANITNLTEKTIRNIINGKTKADATSISRFESAFEMRTGALYSFIKNYESSIEKYDDSVEELNKYLGPYSKSSFPIIFKKLFKGKNKEEYKNYLKDNLIKHYIYKDNDLANIWIAMALRKSYGHEIKNEFRKAYKEKVYDCISKYSMSDESFEIKNEKLITELSSYGIHIINAPYIQKSSIRGVSLIKNKRGIILLNDQSKRECMYYFALIHEVTHLFMDGSEEDVNKYAAHFIKSHLQNNQISKEYKIISEAYENFESTEKLYKIIHDCTKRKINFGDAKQFIQENLFNI